MKDNCLRIPNITRNLYLSLSVLEIIAIEEHQIGETGSKDCGAILGVVELSYTCYRSNLCNRLG